MEQIFGNNDSIDPKEVAQSTKSETEQSSKKMYSESITDTNTIVSDLANKETGPVKPILDVSYNNL